LVPGIEQTRLGVRRNKRDWEKEAASSVLDIDEDQGAWYSFMPNICK